jgi:hypothetical protein
MKKCPYCAEELQNAAAVCKQCGGLLQASDQSGLFESTFATLSMDKRAQASGLLLVAIGTLLMIVHLAADTAPGPAGYFGMVVMLLGLTLWAIGKFTQWSHSRIK